MCCVWEDLNIRLVIQEETLEAKEGFIIDKNLYSKNDLQLSTLYIPTASCDESQPIPNTKNN